MDDGCNTEAYPKNDKNNPANDIKSSFQVKAYKAGVRCCNVKDDSCETIGTCPKDATTFDNAVEKCAAKGLMLCTKNQLLRGVCCGKGGNCDSHPVWTSTPQKQGGKFDGKSIAIQFIKTDRKHNFAFNDNSKLDIIDCLIRYRNMYTKRQ